MPYTAFRINERRIFDLKLSLLNEVSIKKVFYYKVAYQPKVYAIGKQNL